MVKNNRFQNKVSKSSVTLPLCMVLGTLVWFWNIAVHDLPYSWESLAAFCAVVLITYLVMETSNKFALLRLRSNMVATVWVVGVALMPMLHHWSAGWLVALALAGCHYCILHTYQDVLHSVIHIFHAFVLLGVAALAVPQMLVLVPLLYWYLLVFMRCMSWRGLWAGVVGFVLPVSIVLGWCIIMGDYTFLVEWAGDLVSVRPFVGESYDWMLDYRNTRALLLAVFALLSFTGIVHYLRNYYNDKIRTRMYLYIYTGQTIVCWLMILCLPSRLDFFVPSLVLSGSTMVAHFFALTGTWVSNAFFSLTLVAIVALTLINMGVWTY